MENKVCSKCGVEKPLPLFHKNKARKDGVSVYCKDCCNQSKRIGGEYHHLEMKRSEERKGKKEILEYQREYRERNRGKKRKLKPKTTIQKLRNSISRRIHYFLGGKSKPTTKILGCSLETFRDHIENLFQPGMNWNNHTKYGWHLDHIIPLSSATSEEEIYKLNHYSNLQPLWWHENLSKGNKLPEEWLNENPSN